MSKNKEYANSTRDTDKSLMDTLAEIGTAVMEGFRGSQRASQNPASEGSRAHNRMEQRGVVGKGYREAEGKAYGGRTKMMCGGKAHGKKK